MGFPGGDTRPRGAQTLSSERVSGQAGGLGSGPGLVLMALLVVLVCSVRGVSPSRAWAPRAPTWAPEAAAAQEPACSTHAVLPALSSVSRKFLS